MKQRPLDRSFDLHVQVCYQTPPSKFSLYGTSQPPWEWQRMNNKVESSRTLRRYLVPRTSLVLELKLYSRKMFNMFTGHMEEEQYYAIHKIHGEISSHIDSAFFNAQHQFSEHLREWGELDIMSQIFLLDWQRAVISIYLLTLWQLNRNALTSSINLI